MAHNLLDMKPEAQSVLVFGPPKSGKTKLIAELAEHDFTLVWFDIENGSSTLTQLSDKAKKNVTLIKIRDTIENPRAHATLDKITRGGTFKICDAHGTVDCAICKQKGIFNDNHTEITIPSTHLEANPKVVYVLDSASQLTISVNATVTINRDDTYKEQFDDWGAQGKYLNRILSRVQNSVNNWAVTAHEILSEREDGAKRLAPSIGTTNYAINSAKFFGHVVYLDKVNLKHRAWSSTSYSNNVITGSRLNIAVEDMPSPSLADIFEGKAGAGNASISAAKDKATAVLAGLGKGNSNSSKLSGILEAKKQ